MAAIRLLRIQPLELQVRYINFTTIRIVASRVTNSPSRQWEQSLSRLYMQKMTAAADEEADTKVNPIVRFTAPT